MGAVGAVVTLGLLAGCSAQTDGDADEPEQVEPAKSLTMAFGGDVMFEQHLSPLAYNEDSLVELRDTLGAADLSVVNLETSLTEGGTPFPGKPFTFRAPASALDALHNAGVDAVSMANNHAFDYGESGAEDTFDAKDSSPIPVIGIGRDEDEAFEPAVLEANGAKVAVISASEVYEETLEYNSAGDNKMGIASATPRDRLLEEVRKADEEYDAVVVMMHWGIEALHCPGEQAIETSEELEKAGADVIVGGHQHRVNGHGWLDDAYVHYGTGNFIYYLNRDTAGHTGVLTVTLDIPASDEEQDGPLVSEAEWQPMLIGGDGIPRPVDASTEANLQALTDGYRECTPATEESS